MSVQDFVLYVTAALYTFRANAGGIPRHFHSDFDKKLIGGKILKWILANKNNIIAVPAGCQSVNDLVKRTWPTVLKIARGYITEKQVGQEFWYYAVQHTAIMNNQCPGRLGLKLTTPFELVHNKKPKSETWFQLFSVG